MARSSTFDVALRLSAALVATAPLALFAGMALAAFAPVSHEARAAIGLYTPLPLYVLFACLAARARAVFAWPLCLGLASALWWFLR